MHFELSAKSKKTVCKYIFVIIITSIKSFYHNINDSKDTAQCWSIVGLALVFAKINFEMLFVTIIPKENIPI